jgi:hypothetical protein
MLPSISGHTVCLLSHPFEVALQSTPFQSCFCLVEILLSVTDNPAILKPLQPNGSIFFSVVVWEHFTDTIFV